MKKHSIKIFLGLLVVLAFCSYLSYRHGIKAASVILKEGRSRALDSELCCLGGLLNLDRRLDKTYQDMEQFKSAVRSSIRVQGVDVLERFFPVGEDSNKLDQLEAMYGKADIKDDLRKMLTEARARWLDRTTNIRANQ